MAKPISEELRRAAMLEFVFNPEAPSVTDLRDRPEFSAIPVKTLYHWCKTDGWVQQRTSVRRQWDQRLIKTLGDEMVEERRQSLKKTRLLRDKAWEIIEKRAVDPAFARSLEGVGRLMLQADERLESMTRLQLEVFNAQKDQEETGPTSDWNEMEIQVATEAVLEYRMENKEDEAA